MNALRRLIDNLVGRREPEVLRVDNRERRLRALSAQLDVLIRSNERTAIAAERLAKQGKR